jgi:hypothetical protein
VNLICPAPLDFQRRKTQSDQGTILIEIKFERPAGNQVRGFDCFDFFDFRLAKPQQNARSLNVIKDSRNQMGGRRRRSGALWFSATP